jgi:hypothetical protein
MFAPGGVARGRPDMATQHLNRDERREPLLNLEAIKCVDGVAGPETIYTLRDTRINASTT